MPSISTATPARLLPVSEEVRRGREALPLSMARMLLIATLLAAPLAFGAVQAWAWALLAVLAVVLLFLWALGQVVRHQLSIAWSPIYLPAALFLMFGLIQFLGHLTQDPLATRESLIKLVTGLIFFFLAGQLIGTASRAAWRKLGFAVTLFAFALALFAILQFFSSHGLIYWAVKSPGPTFGPYVNHNHYAGLMEMLIPLGAGYIFSLPKDHPNRALLGFAVVLAAASVPLSGSRGGLIALLAEVLILLVVVLLLGPGLGRSRLTQVAALGVTAAALLFFWADPGNISKRLATIVDLPESPTEVSGGRTRVWLDSAQMFRANLWRGTGLGSFEVAYSRYQTFATDLVWDHAHNDYVEALAETGLVGGILIAAALGLFFRLAFKHLGERLQHSTGWIRFGATLGCCGLLVHSFGDFNLHIPANAAWFAVCAALGTSLTTRPTEQACQTLSDKLP